MKVVSTEKNKYWNRLFSTSSLSFSPPSLEINSRPFALCASGTSQIVYRRYVSIFYRLIHACVHLLLPAETIHWRSLSVLETGSRHSTLQSRKVSPSFLYSGACLFKCLKCVLQIQVYIVSVKERLPKFRFWNRVAENVNGVPVVELLVVRASCLCKKRRPFVLWRALVFGSIGFVENETSYHVFTTIARL